MLSDLPQTRPITERIELNASAVSLTVEFDCAFTPGQFLMVWLPGIDEKPFSVSRHRPGACEITIKRRGPVSEKMANLAPGDLLGVRGPYGNGFSISEGADSAEGCDCLFVGGGVGLAALAPLIERFPDAPVLYGENSAAERLFAERFPEIDLFTVDGSTGRQGFPTDGLADALARHRPRMVYTCGPEIMMAKAAAICREAGVPSQLSLERYMKCAVGVCGQCCMDGQRVCIDGPVFSGEQLLDAHDFGFRQLDKSGAWTPTVPGAMIEGASG